MQKIAIIALGLAFCILFHRQGVAQDSTSVPIRHPAETLKERLSDKASDPQRVNDCKVPPEKRGNSGRSAECGPASEGNPDKSHRAAQFGKTPADPLKEEPQRR